jgi:hypothetical protein
VGRKERERERKKKKGVIYTGFLHRDKIKNVS